MIDRLAALIIDESKWLTLSMGVAMLAVTLSLRRHRRPDLLGRHRVLAVMSLLFGVTIGTMAIGHLLAVTTKFALGRLEGSLPILYLIGVALAVPSWWLVGHTRRVLEAGDDRGRATVGLNAWLAVTLAALGVHNLPLAAPGILNVGYHFHSKRAVGWTIVGLTVVVNLGVFIGSLVFLASGQNFEQFRGIR